jgi:dihydroxyacetone kinase-like protein
MAETIGYDEIVRMLRSAADKIRANRDELSKLDSAIGDGDHGTTIARAMDIAEKVLEEDKSKKIMSLLNDVGWGVMGVDGGATGPLLSSFLMGMSEGMEDQHRLDVQAVAGMLAAGLSSVQKQTKGRVGDKTMIDAFVPAVEAFRESSRA